MLLSHTKNRGEPQRLKWDRPAIQHVKAFLDDCVNRKVIESMAIVVKEQQVTLDNIRITYLSDGYALVHPTPLYPMSTVADWQTYQHLLNTDGQLVCSVGAYVIQTPSTTVLVDPGIGPKRMFFL